MTLRSQHGAMVVWWLALSCIFLLQPFGAIFLVLASLALTILGFWLIRPDGGEQVAWRRGATIYTLSLGVILVAHLLAARPVSEAIFLLNHIMLLAPLFVFRYAAHFRGAVWIERIALLATAGALLICAIAVSDVLFLGRTRAVGYWAGGPARFAHISLFLCLFSGSGLLIRGRRAPAWLFLIGPVAALVAVGLSGTRGSMVVVPVLVLWMLAVALRGVARKKLIGAGAAAVAALGLAGLLVVRVLPDTTARLMSVGNGISEIITTGTATNTSIDARLQYYRASLKAFVESPIWGHGWAGGLERVRELLPVVDYPTVPYEVWTAFNHLHNDLFSMIVSYGMLGALSMAMMLAAPWIAIYQNDEWRPLRIFLAGGITIIAVLVGLTDAFLVADHNSARHVFMTALVLGTYRPGRESDARERSQSATPPTGPADR